MTVLRFLCFLGGLGGCQGTKREEDVEKQRGNDGTLEHV